MIFRYLQLIQASKPLFSGDVSDIQYLVVRMCKFYLAIAMLFT